MRTTLDIDDNVLFAAKEHVRLEGKTVGQVVSALARSGLLADAAPKTSIEETSVFGFRPFPKNGRVASNALINKLRQSGEY